MSKKKLIVSAVLTLIVIFGIYKGIRFYNERNAVKSAITIYLKVDTGGDFSKISTLSGNTALQATKERMDVKTKGEGKNAYIISINGYEAKASNKEFWAFYINGKKSDVGAGSYKLKPDDKIEWKVEKF